MNQYLMSRTKELLKAQLQRIDHFIVPHTRIIRLGHKEAIDISLDLKPGSYAFTSFVECALDVSDVNFYWTDGDEPFQPARAKTLSVINSPPGKSQVDLLGAFRLPGPDAYRGRITILNVGFATVEVGVLVSALAS